MSKEITKTVTNVPVVYDAAAWGDNEMSQADLVIPKINLMQPTSEQVNDGLAKFGDFINSLDNSVVGDDKGFEFIPFFMQKFHWVSKLKDPRSNEFKFERTEQVTCAADEQKPWDDCDPDGTPIKRTFVRRFYGMIAGSPAPVTIDAKGMSGNFAKKLATQMYVMNKAANLPPCGKAVIVKAIKQKNAKGNFATFDFSLSRSTTADEIGACLGWYKTLASKPAAEEKEPQTSMNF